MIVHRGDPFGDTNFKCKGGAFYSTDNRRSP